MYYYKIWVASQQYHGKEPLTYSSERELRAGSVVILALRQKNVVGVVLNKTAKPAFTTKPIEKVLVYRIPEQSLNLLSWLMDYYPSGGGVLTSLFVPKTLGSVSRSRPQPNITKPAELKLLPTLTKEQQSVAKRISAHGGRSFLLHGETGSGKTRIYLEEAQKTIKSGRSVLVLTPEISLTPQLVNNFEEVFGNRVLTVHSSLTEAQRRKVWVSVIDSTEPVIIIGPRSALFEPFKNLGLIVVDESQEAAYKQNQSPHYHAHRVAAKLAELHQAKLIMGSATPSITDYYIAKAKNIPILRMKEKAVKTTLHDPKIIVVLARDRDSFTRDPHLSDPMLGAIGTALESGEQSLVFLNRRGTARLVVCQSCGWQAICPNCDLPLTYHGDSHSMRCHTCGYKALADTHCPVCQSTDIIYRSAGTKSIAQSLAKLFPGARIGRYDSDNLSADRFEQQYDQVSEGKVDILVGTQVLAKGLDLPRLSVVGVVAADTSLSFPDYTAEERTYQLLTQIIGRVGRGHRAGTAIVQTHNPEGPAILAAINKAWPDFYEQQLNERRQFGFPPFCHLLKLTCVRKSRTSAEKAGQSLSELLQKLPLKIQIIGPSPGFYEKTRNGYQWQITVKAKRRQDLLAVIEALQANWSYDIDPSSLL